MKTSISIWSFHKEYGSGRMDVPKFLAESKRLGYKAVELLAAWTNTPEQIEEVKKVTADLGLKVSSYGASNDFALSGADLDAQIDSVKRAIGFAAELKAPIVRVFSANIKEVLTFNRAFVSVVKSFQKVAKTAEDAGVTMALENHGKLACTSDQVKRIIEDVGSPALRSCLDIGNFLIADEDPVHAAENLAKLVAHVHVKDHKCDNVTADKDIYVSIKGKKLWPEVIGNGQIDFVKIFRILKDAGFKGYLSLEYEGNEPEPEGVYTSTHNLFRMASEAEKV